MCRDNQRTNRPCMVVPSEKPLIKSLGVTFKSQQIGQSNAQ